MSNKIFNNKNGDLSQYALHCGYIQIYPRYIKDNEHVNISTGYEIQLREDGCCYHVEIYLWEDNYLVYKLWESFDLLTDARRYFNKNKTNIKILNLDMRVKI